MKFKDLVFASKKKRELLEELKKRAGRDLDESDQNKLEDHLDLVDRTFKMDESLTYQELDSIENPNLYSEDDVVEIFIRANSGGTRLGKSDLLFSLLGASWDRADERMEGLLESLNHHGFEFDRDFVLKTSLTVLDQGARYEIEKFRKKGVREEVEEKWDDISAAIRDVLDFVRGKTFIQGHKALPTYLVLIPLIYLRYRYPEAWRKAKDVDSYILRASLAGAFGGNVDNLLDGLVKKVEEIKRFDLNEMFGVIRSQGRSLELTEERFWHMGYGSEAIHLLFNLWYREFTYTPAYENNLPQIDHIFPQSALRKVKIENPKTGRKDSLRYREADRNQLANCMLLTKKENGGGGKGDTLPEDWFEGQPAGYLKMHLIPSDKKLWKLERFEDFISARKTLIRDQFRELLVPASTSSRAPEWTA